jgi:ubiquinone/menaquinone biosynthesis C-methylase UbiE
MARTLATEAEERWKRRRLRMCDDLAPDYAREREAQYSFQAQKRIVLEMLAGLRGRILDAGCGPALMEPALLDLDLEVEAIDVSTEMVRLAQARLASHPLAARCRVGVGEVERLEYPDRHFDAVLAMGVLEYVADHGAALREMHRVLKPGGAAVLSVPNRYSAYRVTRNACTRAIDWLRRRPIRPEFTGAPGENRSAPWRFDEELERAGLRRRAGRFCNFIVFPLYDRAPGLSDTVNRALSWLSATPLGAAGNQYVVSAVKAP